MVGLKWFVLPNFPKISRLAHGSGKVLTSAKNDGKGKIPLKVLVGHSHIAQGRLVTWLLFMLDKNISQKLPGQPFPRPVSHTGVTSCGLELWSCVSKQWVKWLSWNRPESWTFLQNVQTNLPTGEAEIVGFLAFPPWSAGKCVSAPPDKSNTPFKSENG